MKEGFEELRRRSRQEWDALQHGPHPRILVGTATCGRSAEPARFWRRFARNSGAADLTAS